MSPFLQDCALVATHRNKCSMHHQIPFMLVTAAMTSQLVSLYITRLCFCRVSTSFLCLKKSNVDFGLLPGQKSHCEVPKELVDQREYVFYIHDMMATKHM